MQLVKTVPFSHDGHKYEVRVFMSDEGYEVVACRDGKPVNGYRYHVTFEDKFDMRVVEGSDAIGHLIEMAKDDVVSGRWEALLAVLRS